MHKEVGLVFQLIMHWPSEDYKRICWNAKNVACNQEDLIACMTEGLDPSRTIELQTTWNSLVTWQNEQTSLCALSWAWRQMELVPYGFSKEALCWMKASLHVYVRPQIRLSKSI